MKGKIHQSNQTQHMRHAKVFINQMNEFEINRHEEKKRDSFNQSKYGSLGKPCHYIAIITEYV